MFLWAVSSPSLWFAHYSINHSLDYWSVMCKQYELRLSNISKTPHCIPQPGLFVTLFVNSFSLSLLWGSMLTLLTVAGYSISSTPWQCPLVMTSAILAHREGLGSPWSSEGKGCLFFVVGQKEAFWDVESWKLQKAWSGGVACVV